MRNEHGQFLSGRNHPMYKKILKNCLKCNKEMLVLPNRKYCSKSCAAQANRGNGTGKFIDTNGYVYIYMPQHPNAKRGGTIAEHRVVMEKKIGRLLSSHEDVHHKNGIKTDNRQSNLIVLSRSEHQKLHLSKRFSNKSKMIERKCINCGRVFEILWWRLKDEQRGRTCSLSCSGKLGHKIMKEKLQWQR